MRIGTGFQTVLGKSTCSDFASDPECQSWSQTSNLISQFVVLNLQDGSSQ